MSNGGINKLRVDFLLAFFSFHGLLLMATKSSWWLYTYRFFLVFLPALDFLFLASSRSFLVMKMVFSSSFRWFLSPISFVDVASTKYTISFFLICHLFHRLYEQLVITQKRQFPHPHSEKIRILAAPLPTICGSFPSQRRCFRIGNAARARITSKVLEENISVKTPPP